MYKRSNDDRTLSEFERTRNTLLEYEGLPTKREDKSISSTEKVPKAAYFGAKQHVEQPEVPLPADLLKAEATSTVSIENVICGVVGDEHQKLSADYSSDIGSIIRPLSNSQYITDRAEYDENRNEDVLKNLSEIKAKLEGELSEKNRQWLLQTERLNKLKAREDEILNQNKRFDAVEESVEPKKLEMLRELLESRDEVRKMESDFKDRCKREAAAMETEKERLLNRPVINGNDEEYLLRLTKKRNELSKNLAESRKRVADVNKQIASLRRKIDSVPSRLELNQYQRRFVELYNEIASLQKEAKKFYILYNTLCDVKTYMEKEVGLLDSVYDTYERGLYTDQLKLQFVRQLEQSFDTIRQLKLRAEKKHGEERHRRDCMKDTYQELLDRQRFYYKVVSDFREECKKNELLRESLERQDHVVFDRS